MARRPNSPREEVLQIIVDGGALERTQIMRAATTVEDAKQLANILYNLKAAGYITLKDGKYRAVAKRAKAAPPESDDWPVPPAQTPPPMTIPKAPVVTDARGDVRSVPRPHDALDLPPPPRAEPERAHSGELLEILERAAHDSQDALDEYVWMVGDPSILKPLMKSRDAAREALAAYQEVHADA